MELLGVLSSFFFPGPNFPRVEMDPFAIPDPFGGWAFSFKLPLVLSVWLEGDAIWGGIGWTGRVGAAWVGNLEDLEVKSDEDGDEKEKHQEEKRESTGVER